MTHPVVHFEIMGKDAKKLQDFYSTLFDWKLNAFSPEYGMTEIGGDHGINGGIGASGEMPPYVTVYVQVPDLQAALDKVATLGGKTVVPPTEIPNVVTFALFSDLEGNVVGLVKG